MAANASMTPPKLDRYVVIHVATTCDEHGVYVTKDSAEVIEVGWVLLDTKTCDEVRHRLGTSQAEADSAEQIHRESILVKPVNTPITPLCSESDRGGNAGNTFIR